jgi:DNA-binding MarR family transcriptional regulator
MAATETGVGPIGLGKRLRLAHMAFSRALRLELAKHDVTFGQFVHLENLWSEDGLTQTELSHRVGIETASSTSILDQLETLGLVDRRRNSSDRRKINVYLTPKGADLQPVLYRAAAKVNAVARGEMSASDVSALISILDRIADSVSATYPGSNATNARTRLGS